MAARAIAKKIYVNPQALSMIRRVFLSPGIDRTRSCSEMVKATVKTSSAEDESKTIKDNVNKVKAVVYDDVWKKKIVEEIEETGLKLLQLLRKLRDEEDEMFIDSNDKVVNYMKPIYKLWSKKIEEEERKLLQEGWTHLRDSLLGTPGLETCHIRSLLSIQHHIGSGGEEIVKFATASPHTGLIDVRRLALQRPGPYGLPRQVVVGVVCITTNDAFLLYNPTTGAASPWIETTTTRKGKARRQVESIALGFDHQFVGSRHKVICISRYVKKRSAPPDPKDDFLVVEVLTVRDRIWDIGEHEWRELEFTPRSFVVGDKFVFLDGPLYMDVQEFIDSSKHMWSMLMEVDGKVAILKSTSDEETSSLWICYHSPCGEVKWSKEKIPVPYAYVVSPGFSIEALRRKDLIFIRSRRRISYYNRKTKVSLSLKIPPSPIHDHFDCGRMTQF
ncbi:uncharacterized protein LOC113356254 isoform X2 [Papaver somniferum]|uniref:uncharacterized protein LOC113356254 isoform X2 n=1 Tax=Papaver somniferum TaxID=3469 RepID=UPI000E6FA096|nr:uncharacterized protein LOC113356254 isoform X2 [Papaver somniferum]